MIAYEELCAALERFRSGQGGEAPHVEMPTGPVDPPTHEHTMPPIGAQPDDDHTNVGLEPVYDDRSNELDIGDVLSDEEAPKN